MCVHGIVCVVGETSDRRQSWGGRQGTCTASCAVRGAFCRGEWSDSALFDASVDAKVQGKTANVTRHGVEDPLAQSCICQRLAAHVVLRGNAARAATQPGTASHDVETTDHRCSAGVEPARCGGRRGWRRQERTWIGVAVAA
eukprot:SAG11_NODE_1916_length_4071_cov_3.418429_5_plen_142_part_00